MIFFLAAMERQVDFKLILLQFTDWYMSYNLVVKLVIHEYSVFLWI